MSIEDKVEKFNDLVQSSFRNAMDTVESIHQTNAEIPIEILKEFGYPEDKAEIIKDSHRRILRLVYGGICSAHESLGNLVVRQFGELGKFTSGLADSGNASPANIKKTKTSRKSSRAKSVKKVIDAPSVNGT